MWLDLRVNGNYVRQYMRAMAFGWLLVLADVICRAYTWQREYSHAGAAIRSNVPAALSGVRPHAG
jgi:hypothetical protein